MYKETLLLQLSVSRLNLHQMDAVTEKEQLHFH